MIVVRSFRLGFRGFMYGVWFSTFYLLFFFCVKRVIGGYERKLRLRSKLSEVLFCSFCIVSCGD